MLIVRPATEDWRASLVTGTAVGSTIEAWIAGGSYNAPLMDGRLQV